MNAHHTRTGKGLSKRRLVWGSVALCTVLGLGVLWQRPNRPNPEKGDHRGRVNAAQPAEVVHKMPTTATQRVVLAQANAREHHARVAFGSNVDHDEHAEESDSKVRRESHPIDDARRRIYRENDFNVAFMGAMNVGDYRALRTLLDEYQRAYPEDEHQLQEGYTIVADCLERLTVERQTEARAYWTNNRASIVRRFIRRHCLDRAVVDG